ncbi:MAG: hypothetical protein H6581_26580 [Bacteroidia bacterium]|nr:hypothetical protein [Bacteroidia bacterium]
MAGFLKGIGKFFHVLFLVWFGFLVVQNVDSFAEIMPFLFLVSFSLVALGWILERVREKILRKIQGNLFFPSQSFGEFRTTFWILGAFFMIIGLSTQLTGLTDHGYGLATLGALWASIPFLRPRTGVLLTEDNIEVRLALGHFKLNFSAFSGLKIRGEEIWLMLGKSKKVIPPKFLETDDQFALLRALNQSLLSRGLTPLEDAEDLTGEF